MAHNVGTFLHAEAWQVHFPKDSAQMFTWLLRKSQTVCFSALKWYIHTEVSNSSCMSVIWVFKHTWPCLTPGLQAKLSQVVSSSVFASDSIGALVLNFPHTGLQYKLQMTGLVCSCYRWHTETIIVVCRLKSFQDFYIRRPVCILHSCGHGTFGSAESHHAICHCNLRDTPQFLSFKYMSNCSV